MGKGAVFPTQLVWSKNWIAETNNQVARDIFIDLSNEPLLLKDYITIEKKTDATLMMPVAKFSGNL